MAVAGPLRALAVARGQALYNQLRREAGGAGFAGAAIVAVLVPLALAAPTIGSYLVGQSLGAVILHPARGATAVLSLSGFLLFVPLGIGFLAGLLGGNEVAGTPLRLYPLSRRERLAARFLAPSLGLGPLLAFASLLGLGVGVSAARPAFAPVALLLCAQAAVFVLVVQHLVSDVRSGSLAGSALAAAGFAVLLKATGRPLLSGAGSVLQAVLPWSPTMFGVQGLADIASGRFATAGLRQLLPLAVTALAVEATARHAARAEPRPSGGRASGAGRERLWSFRAPAHGVARLLVSSVARSRHGLTLFFMPAGARAVGRVVPARRRGRAEPAPGVCRRAGQPAGPRRRRRSRSGRLRRVPPVGRVGPAPRAPRPGDCGVRRLPASPPVPRAAGAGPSRGVPGGDVARG